MALSWIYQNEDKTLLCSFFFKFSFNKRAGTLILELDQDNVSILVKFEYYSPSPLIEGELERTNMISCLFFWKYNTLLSWKSSLCWNVNSLEKGKWLIFLQKNLKHNRHNNYDNDDYNDDDDDDNDNDPKGPQTGLVPGG